MKTKMNYSEIFDTLLYINTYYYASISTYLLSIKAGMPEKKYIRGFQKLFGMTPNQHILLCRLYNACNYLIVSKHSISKISSLCGFTNSSYFYRAFKKVYNMTPGEFRYRQLHKDMI